jgi:hypothetical protein
MPFALTNNDKVYFLGKQYDPGNTMGAYELDTSTLSVPLLGRMHGKYIFGTESICLTSLLLIGISFSLQLIFCAAFRTISVRSSASVDVPMPLYGVRFFKLHTWQCKQQPRRTRRGHCTVTRTSYTFCTSSTPDIRTTLGHQFAIPTTIPHLKQTTLPSSIATSNTGTTSSISTTSLINLYSQSLFVPEQILEAVKAAAGACSLPRTANDIPPLSTHLGHQVQAALLSRLLTLPARPKSPPPSPATPLSTLCNPESLHSQIRTPRS